MSPKLGKTYVRVSVCTPTLFPRPLGTPRCICTFTLLTNHLAVVKVKLALSLLTCTVSWQTGGRPSSRNQTRMKQRFPTV